MNIFRNTDPAFILVPLTWRQRAAAHVFDEMIIALLSLPFSWLLSFSQYSGMPWIVLANWLILRTLCHMVWHGVSWRKSHATPGLWMFRAKVKTLRGAIPSRDHRRLLARPATPLLLRAAFFIVLSLTLNWAIPESQWGALVWIWCWGELCVMLSTLLAPWRKGFSNTAPTAQDLSTQSRAFIDRPQTFLDFLARAIMLAIVAAPFCLFIFATGEAALRARVLEEPFLNRSGSSMFTSCGIVKQALNSRHDCRTPYF